MRFAFSEINFLHYRHIFVANGCSRTSVARWRNRCVNGFLSFNPLALSYIPPDMTHSKLCEDLMFWKLFGIVLTKIYGLPQ